MGYRAGLHVLAPEPSGRAPSFATLCAIGGVFAGIVIAGTLVRAGIELGKRAGDAFVLAWMGSDP